MPTISCVIVHLPNFRAGRMESSILPRTGRRVPGETHPAYQVRPDTGRDGRTIPVIPRPRGSWAGWAVRKFDRVDPQDVTAPSASPSAATVSRRPINVSQIVFRRTFGQAKTDGPGVVDIAPRTSRRSILRIRSSQHCTHHVPGQGKRRGPDEQVCDCYAEGVDASSPWPVWRM